MGRHVVMALWVVAAACFATPAGHADTVFTKDGVRLEGEIQEPRESYLRIKTTGRGLWQVSRCYDEGFQCANKFYLKTRIGVVCVPVRDVLRIEKTSDAPRTKARDAHKSALAALARGKIDAAIAGFEAAIAADPAFPDAYIELGDVIRFSKKDVPGAMERFAKAIALEPDNFLAHFGLGLCHHDLFASDRDEAALEKAAAEYRKAQALNPAYAHVELKLAAVPIEPEGIDAIECHLANAALLEGLPAEARPIYEKIIARVPEYAAPRAGLGILLYNEGKTAEALANLEAAVRLGDTDPRTLAYLGNACLYSEPRRLDEAVEAYKQAIDAAASRPLDTMLTLIVLDGLSLACGMRGELDASEEWAVQIVEVKPDYVNAHYNLACADAERGKKKEACKDLENAFKWALEQGTLKRMLEQAEGDESFAGLKSFFTFRKLLDTYKKKVG